MSFDNRDKLGDKINKLTVMLGRLAAKDNNEKRPFKPEIYQGRGRQQNRGYSQRYYQNRNRLNNRSGSRARGQFRDGPRFEQNYRGKLFGIMPGDMEEKTAEGNIEMRVIDVMVTIEVAIDQEIGHSQEFIVVIGLEVQAVVDLGQDPGPVLIGIE